MSEWVNAGATVEGGSITTKKALKELIGQTPHLVYIYVTDAFGAMSGREFYVDDLPSSYKFTVVGPDPYTSRKWFATVEKLPNGTITVK